MSDYYVYKKDMVLHTDMSDILITFKYIDRVFHTDTYLDCSLVVMRLVGKI